MHRHSHNQHPTRVIAGVFCLWVSVLWSVSAHAVEDGGGAPGDWVSRYSTARTLGFGGAFTAVADEPLGALWNPAGLTKMMHNSVHFEMGRLLEGASVNGVSFGAPSSRLPSFGVTLLSLRSGDIERTSELNEPLGDFSETDLAFLMTAAKHFGRRMGIGANLKIIRQSVEEFDASGVGADLGFLYEVSPAIRLGVSIHNLGGPSLALREIKESYPTEVRAGIAVKGLRDRAVITADLHQRSGPGTALHTGSEFWIHPLMAFRAGYHDGEPAGGISIQASPEFRIDYGLADHELGVMHRFGVSYRFGGFFAKSAADPPVFSPVGQRSVTKFHLKARTKADAQEWTLLILDKFKQTVRQFSGKGIPPAHIVWDGKDETGLPLPDGTYRYRLVVTDREGREIQGHSNVVEIATGGPRGTVPAVVG